MFVFYCNYVNPACIAAIPNKRFSFFFRRKRQHQQQKCDGDQPKVPLPGVISSVYEDIECMNNQKNEATYEEIEYENKKNNDTYEHPNFEPAHSPYCGDVEHVYQARCVD